MCVFHGFIGGLIWQNRELNQNLREVNRMEIYRDGVEIDILPETAKCCADDAERNPLNINMCPIGEQYCSGDCDYYTENQNLKEARYEKVKRLCIYPNKDTEPKMHTLYECHGKSGTTESTVLWFLEPPVKGCWYMAQI